MDRNNIFLMLLLGILFSLAFKWCYASVETALYSPVGYWKTRDATTGQPTSIVQIWKTPDQALVGKIIKVFPQIGEKSVQFCTACRGDKHNKPLLGMVILSELKTNQNHWGNGKILNIETGNTYSCALQVTDNGKRLNVHRYIGIPLFGFSQTWERIDLMAG